MPTTTTAPRQSTLKDIKGGYVPPERLTISPKLKLHRKQETSIDPVTFEVIRHSLWNVNEEHGATIQRLSGSPVAMYALDLNPSILTEDGEFVFFGPYMQYMSGVTDTQVKWILENRSDNPGIRDGDMFLANDPWVGAAHQQDVMLICPVFHGDELFCWVTNCLHQYDIGGITPSSFCLAAENAYEEGILLPPIKIVENGEIRRDIEELYLRASRKPEAVALDFRAQLAGNHTAKARIEALLERYGATVVKAVMRKIINDGERAFLEKMARLPDGRWQDRTYVECCRPGDRNAYRVMLSLEKKGATLTFRNEGTSPQDGAMNATFSGWRGSIMVALNQLLCWDQYFAIGGALRHVKFDPTPGTMNCAEFPASVSTAPVQAMEISLYPTYNVLSKMIFSDPQMRKDIMCIGGTSQWPATIFRGTDQWGDPFGYLLIDPIGGAIGAFAQSDGISTGGQSRTPICKLPNIEHTEQTFPLLFLYRKEVVDSGGAGQYRGGLSAESCFIPHGTTSITHDTLSSGNAIPTSTGMMGGYPATVNVYKFRRDSTISRLIEKSAMPGDISEVGGREEVLALRQQNFQQGRTDVYSVIWTGGGGFGDPLERDPESVRFDVVEQMAVSVDSALDIYGVVILGDQVNEEVTESLRTTLRSRRKSHPRQSSLPLRTLGGKPIREITANLSVRSDPQAKGKARKRWCCAGCANDLGPATENYKLACAMLESPVTASNPHVGDPSRYIDSKPVFRQFFCPSCGLLIENEIALSGDPILRDIEVAA
ncbi:MAG: hydantoinase B/oxoprolinase family protein [Betaproteobacteria bacterium]